MYALKSLEAPKISEAGWLITSGQNLGQIVRVLYRSKTQFVSRAYPSQKMKSYSPAINSAGPLNVRIGKGAKVAVNISPTAKGCLFASEYWAASSVNSEALKNLEIVSRSSLALV